MAQNTVGDMARHSAIIGFVIFLYMGTFGHSLPGREIGPFRR